MKRISLKIIMAIVACSVGISVLIGTISIVRSTDIISSRSDQELKILSENHAREIDQQFELLKAEADGLSGMVASTISIQEVKNNPYYMQQYINSIKPAVKSFAQNGRINVNAYVFFSPDYASSEIVDYIFLINKDSSGFIYDSYDVKVQDMKDKKDEFGWYYAPADAKKGVWSDPYQDTVLNIKLLTYSTPIIVEGTVVGVVGMDIKFDNFEKMLKDIKVYDTGYAFMMNSSYNYLVHPTLTLKDNLRTVSNGLYVPIVAQMDKNFSGTVDLNFNNTNKIMGYSHLSNGFIVALTVPESEILKDMHDLTFFIIILAAVGALLACAIAFLVGLRIAKPIRALSGLFNKAETGDLTVRCDIRSSDEVGQLSRAFNSMLDKMRGFILETKELSVSVASSSSEMVASSEEVSKVSEQVAGAVSELARGSTEQASYTEKGYAKIAGVVDGLQKISADLNNSQELAFRAAETVGDGQSSVRYQVQKMSENKEATESVWKAVSDLSEKSRQIGEILGVIKGIADQTNLLALNAAIEAARAGEQGRGFAVVADEVRKLAEQSNSSVNDIENIINKVQAGVENAVTDMDRARGIVDEQEKALDKTVAVFREIVEKVESIADNIKIVSASATHLSTEVNEAGQEMVNISSIAEEAAANTEEVSASAQEQSSVISQIAQSAESLADMAASLEQSIQRFKA